MQSTQSAHPRELPTDKFRDHTTAIRDTGDD
jgi:hypothetical protein